MVALAVALAGSVMADLAVIGPTEAEQEEALEQVAAGGRQPLVAARAIKGELSYHGITEYEY